MYKNQLPNPLNQLIHSMFPPIINGHGSRIPRYDTRLSNTTHTQMATKEWPRNIRSSDWIAALRYMIRYYSI